MAIKTGEKPAPKLKPRNVKGLSSKKERNPRRREAMRRG
jgi:hypothetical protein